jgi:hypothetical protein
MMAEFRFPAEARDFSLHYSVQTGSGAHPASYTMGTGGSFPRSGMDVKLTHLLNRMPRSEMVELYFHSPIRLEAEEQKKMLWQIFN